MKNISNSKVCENDCGIFERKLRVLDSNSQFTTVNGSDIKNYSSALKEIYKTLDVVADLSQLKVGDLIAYKYKIVQISKTADTERIVVDLHFLNLYEFFVTVRRTVIVAATTEDEAEEQISDWFDARGWDVEEVAYKRKWGMFGPGAYIKQIGDTFLGME